ncbi:DUF1749-domain-containing protein [Parathielavia appendiculata]|uniref:DUF1749-domain-containing protein n=1 Tax=Parathielavia appendiculata TaxID=2587402 RepID=A0AAN6Z3G1_9PEZI|nr:DUF1749-domain-containing protein [Parathielavia appendiculata]
MSTILAPYPVRVHSYRSSGQHPRTVQSYEHLPRITTATAQPKNALVFIGGLGDGPHTIPYVRHLAEHLYARETPPAAVRYAVFETRLSSAFTGFGYASLAQDAREIADMVRYLRIGLGVRRVVLMGHSTGCQDCLEYGSKFLRSTEGTEGEEVRVDGFVLQGPVSDREAIGMVEDKGEVEGALLVAEGMVREGRGEEVMPREVMPKGWRGSPVTAYRWCSLAAVGGDDDYFSSDLPDKNLVEIWGRLEQPVLILPSEKDEWVPAGVDVMGLVNKWKSFCKPGIASELSGLIPGANHGVDNETGQQWLADRVAQFLVEIDKQL